MRGVCAGECAAVIRTDVDVYASSPICCVSTVHETSRHSSDMDGDDDALPLVDANSCRCACINGDALPYSLVCKQ